MDKTLAVETKPETEFLDFQKLVELYRCKQCNGFGAIGKKMCSKCEGEGFE